jgi:translation initiation factor 2 subunit 3
LIEALTGVWAARHSEELKRGITIKLGYADVTIYKCTNCDPPHYSTEKICSHCDSPMEFVRTISFVDAPGHEALMATMLSGAAVMDGGILVIAADETCPQPQTREHLAAIEIVGIKNVVIVQNKIDVVSKERTLKNYHEIASFIKGTVAEEAPIIPVSAQHSINIDLLIEAMEEHIPTPKRDSTKPPRMFVVRSFDVNKPGTKIEDLEGGVIGGTLSQGKFEVGNEIEIRPGIRVEKSRKTIYEPLYTTITTLYTGGESVKEVYCGGLVGIGTLLDPSLTKADGLIGNVIGKPDQLPPTRTELSVEIHLFERAIGTREMAEVEEVHINERILLDVGTTITAGNVVSIKNSVATLKLGRAVCVQEGERISLSRNIANRWRLIGYGLVK